MSMSKNDKVKIESSKLEEQYNQLFGATKEEGDLKLNEYSKEQGYNVETWVTYGAFEKPIF